eukprot:6211981-Pleurochrysis_carterae.AAC.4
MHVVWLYDKAYIVCGASVLARPQYGGGGGVAGGGHDCLSGRFHAIAFFSGTAAVGPAPPRAGRSHEQCMGGCYEYHRNLRP